MNLPKILSPQVSRILPAIGLSGSVKVKFLKHGNLNDTNYEEFSFIIVYYYQNSQQFFHEKLPFLLLITTAYKFHQKKSSKLVRIIFTKKLSFGFDFWATDWLMINSGLVNDLHSQSCVDWSSGQTIIAVKILVEVNYARASGIGDEIRTESLRPSHPEFTGRKRS